MVDATVESDVYYDIHTTVSENLPYFFLSASIGTNIFSGYKTFLKNLRTLFFKILKDIRSQLNLIHLT